MRQQDRYVFRVHYSDEDRKFVATVAEMPSLSWLADSQEKALRGLRTVVDEVVADMQENGEEVPEPLENKEYSGKFVLRLTPGEHKQLALQAAEQHVSLNKLAASRILART
ncbi:toxin-antitoxin system HicB family antitoxin [Bifidobacterium mongoliense]|uniref:type II toxin-antitoxin system HicB family antitoxin n=1 Tax=Bifidobacterium mongoliense TaxID=518643 RepID=UPI002A763C0A|nr:toxin-antitoxin system HicB family antitoxin [Bifidobacterium mongoliense]MDY3125102.1 toxin-antitoxin system HicB family antitoxin [Bifidobacterium mongoliense]